MRLTVDVNFDAGWEESKHPRGQPGNAGEFAKSAGGASKIYESETIEGRYPSGGAYRVEVNPSAGKLARFLKDNPDGLRIAMAGQNYMVSSGVDSTHEDMMDLLKAEAHPLGLDKRIREAVLEHTSKGFLFRGEAGWGVPNGTLLGVPVLVDLERKLFSEPMEPKGWPLALKRAVKPIER